MNGQLTLGMGLEHAKGDKPDRILGIHPSLAFSVMTPASSWQGKFK